MEGPDLWKSDVAVIGMSGRFPGAPDIETYWQNLCHGVDAISRVSTEVDGGQRVQALGKMEGVGLFDASFFGYSPREAEITDPQHRIFLECAWDALDNAGYGSENYRGSVGVYAGTGEPRYGQMLVANERLVRSLGGIHVTIGNRPDFLATRISYKLNLTGPSIAVQTACSTSLVAVHMACQSILSGECDMALAGGISLPSATHGIESDDGGVISTEGYCRAFDANAKGTVGGDGVGVVVLKGLADAVADGDYVHAIIKGSAINNDGARKLGFTAPSVEGQARVITEALAVSDVKPETITYVEAHGTGTPLGDPIEVTALTQAYRKHTNKTSYCALGSGKTNIGHTDAAAGISGFIKTVLALKHKSIPPSLHFETPNPEIDFANTPFYVNQTLSEWKTNGTARRAGVSSFGMGGTNAHVILEEAPVRDAHKGPPSESLLVLSAKTASALEAATRNLTAYLRKSPSVELTDVAYTLQVGRKAFPYRRALVCARTEDAIAALEGTNANSLKTALHAGDAMPVTFLISGDATWDSGSGRKRLLRLHDEEPVFREHLNRCCELLTPVVGVDLRQLLFLEEKRTGMKPDQLLAFQEPISFVIGWSLAQTWLEYGVRPQAVQCEGIGEYVAACLAEVFTLEEAIHLVGARYRVKEDSALPASEAAVDDYRRLARKLKIKQPKLRFISNVTGDWITSEQATAAEYWVTQLHSALPINDAFAKILTGPAACFLEVGAGERLKLALQQHPNWNGEHFALATLPLNQDQPAEGACFLTGISQLWLGGVAVNWIRLHARDQGRRLPLPGYPFESQLYWIGGDSQPSARSERDSDEEKTPSWFYLPSWKRTALTTPANRKQSGADEFCLAFVGANEMDAQIVAALQKEGRRVIRVVAGASYFYIDSGTFTIDPRQHDHYDKMLDQLKASNNTVHSVLYMWMLDKSNEIDHFEKEQFSGFYSLLWLAAALNRNNTERAIQVDVVSSQLQDVTGEENVSPAKAMVFGACQVIPQEFSNIQFRSIDMGAIQPGAQNPARAVSQVLQELRADVMDSFVAYRGSHRYVRTFENIAMDVPPGIPSYRKMEGRYLLTNGLADSDLELARFLAKTVRAKLIFLAPANFPEKSRWGLFKESADGKVSRSITQLQEIEALGAEILVLNTDLQDEANVKRALQTAMERFAGIDGVIHGSPVVELRAIRDIQDVDEQFLERELTAQVRALAHLDAAFKDHALDFFILILPFASILGGAGKSVPAALSWLFASYASERNSVSSTRWMAINLEAWHSAGEESKHQEIFAALMSGIAGAHVVVSRKDFREALKRPAVRRLMTPTLSAEVSTRASANGHGTLLPEPLPSIPAVVQENSQPTNGAAGLGMPKEMEAAAIVASPTIPALHGRPNLSVACVAPNNEAEEIMVAIWQELLGIKEVGINDSFFLLGGDSLQATQMISRLRAAFKIEVPMRYFFEYPTIALMAKAIQTSKENGSQKATQSSSIPRISRAERPGAKAAAAAAAGSLGKPVKTNS